MKAKWDDCTLELPFEEELSRMGRDAMTGALLGDSVGVWGGATHVRASCNPYLVASGRASRAAAAAGAERHGRGRSAATALIHY